MTNDFDKQEALIDTVKHCITEAGTENRDYRIEKMVDEESTVILHANTGFLTDGLTRELRQRLIFVNGSAQLDTDYQASFFLKYLEGEESTFLDDLA